MLRTKMTDGGRLVIPAELRRELALQPGDSVVLEVTDGELRVRSLRCTVEQARAVVRHYLPTGISLSEELIRDRREEAARE